MEQLPDSQLRQRRRFKVEEVVKEFDSFNKVVDSVKEEQSAGNGIITIVCFSLIAILVCIQVVDYIANDDVEYKFSVDTAFDERPVLDLDMIVNTPCNGLNVMVVSHSSAHRDSPESGVSKEPSRFDMDENEQRLWDLLKRAQQDQFKPGTKFKALNVMNFVSSGVESGLLDIAKLKVKEEVQDIAKQRALDAANGVKQHPGGHVVMMIGNGMGMFQLIASNNNGPGEGRACRLSGKVPVLKGDDDRIVISPSNMFHLGGLIGELDTGTKNNMSHRIERFHFGEHTWGLVTPLAGTERMSNRGDTMYKYFVKVVPTRIAGFMGRTTYTYQYSVTAMVREADQPGYTGAGITFVYEFAANVIDVKPKQEGLIQFGLRLCSVVGGIFATSLVLQTLISQIASKVFHKT